MPSEAVSDGISLFEISAHANQPAVFVFCQTVLDVGNRLTDGIAAFLVLHFDFFAVNHERSYRGK